MRSYRIRLVHKISPSDRDVAIADIADSAFSNRNTLAKALRDAGIMGSGHRIREMRVEGDRVIVFPIGQFNPWHSITLSPSEY